VNVATPVARVTESTEQAPHSRCRVHAAVLVITYAKENTDPDYKNRPPEKQDDFAKISPSYTKGCRSGGWSRRRWQDHPTRRLVRDCYMDTAATFIRLL
jgi:hypothetical protein